MFNNANQSDAGRSIFMGSVKGLANTGAAVAAFFATPLLYGQSVDWVRSFTAEHYGPAWVDLTDFGWFILVALLSFFVARASLGTLLIMGGFAIATKLL